jgi:nucleoid-associated protein YejK
MICVSTKDPHSLSFRQKVAGFLEDSLQKTGLRERGIMLIVEIQMIKLGYFLFTINHNSKLNEQNKRYTTNTID